MIAGTLREKPAAPAAQASTPAPLEGVGSYDEDLAWIIERLVIRTGGAFGIISLYLGRENVLSIPACTGILASESAFLRIVGMSARSAVDLTARGGDGVNLRQLSFDHVGEDSRHGSWRMMGLGFSPAEDVGIIACVCRTDGEAPFTLMEEQTAKAQYPLLMRYLRLWWLQRTERCRTNALSMALDLSDVGIGMLNRRGELLFANTRARGRLEQEDGIVARGLRITAADPADAQKLQAAIQRAIEVNLGVKPLGASRREPLLSLRRKNGQRALIAAITSAQRPAIDTRDPAVVFYLVNPEQDTRQLLAPVCELYHLTAVESQLVDHLVAGLRIVEAAEQMRIQPETARTYLKQIFAKTSTNRQADVIRLMLASAIRTNIKPEPARSELMRV